MTAAIALKPVLVSMASEISEMMLPASAATTVAPRMQSVPALHKMRTKPAAALTVSYMSAKHSYTLQEQHLKCLLANATHCGGYVDTELGCCQMHIQSKYTSLSAYVSETCAEAQYDMTQLVMPGLGMGKTLHACSTAQNTS